MKKAWILAAVGALALAGCGPNPVDNSTELNCRPGYNCVTTYTKQTVEEQLEDLQEHRRVIDARISDLEIRMNKVAPTPKPPSYDGYWYRYPTDGGFTWKVYPNNY